VEKESEKSLSLPVGEIGKDQRVDAFLASQIEDLTRSRVQELIRQKLVEVNGAPVKASYRLKTGDRIGLTVPAARPCTLEPEPVEFSVIYEDGSLLVINKPPGIVVHPAPGHSSGTLVHGLLHHCRDLSGIGGIMRPGIVHRLDKDTSGLVVVAKNDKVHDSLSSQFKSGTVRKQYLAIAHGLFHQREGVIDLPIARHPVRRKEMAVSSAGGKKAITFWEKAEELGVRFTLLLVRPRTGRTHQIRVHLSHTGHPIAGDPLYGYKKTWWKRQYAGEEDRIPKIPRQMLHAERLGFIHPETGTSCEFQAAMPADMRECIEELRKLKLRG
jgi:23S rRNA pseudouridine1911/1915/1917 synthase